MAFFQGFLFGQNLKELETQEKIESQKNKIALFKNTLTSMRLDVNKTFVDNFNNSRVAVYDYSSSNVEDRYLFVYLTKQVFQGFRNLFYENKSGLFKYSKNNDSNFADIKYTTGKNVVLAIKSLYYGDPNFSNYIRKNKYEIQGKLYICQWHNTFQKEKSLNVGQLLMNGNLLPETIIFIS